jgi:hypothetical protein
VLAVVVVAGTVQVMMAPVVVVVAVCIKKCCFLPHYLVAPKLSALVPQAPQE